VLAHPLGTTITRPEYKLFDDTAKEFKPESASADTPAFRVPPRTAVGSSVELHSSFI